jgi:stage II sporulation protein D
MRFLAKIIMLLIACIVVNESSFVEAASTGFEMQKKAEKNLPVLVKTDDVQSSKGPELRVGLLQGQTRVVLSANKSYFIYESIGTKMLGKYKPNEHVIITTNKNQLILNGKAVKGDYLLLEPIEDKAETVVSINDKMYRGKAEVHLMKNGLTVVNKVYLEEYLNSVVAEEMPDSWQSEALKAQAIAARTFALYARNKHESEGFDICNGTHCQMYGGISGEAPNASQAVRATTGTVLYYNGKLIYAPFHAAAGGMTENSEDVWGNNLPYLRAVMDFDEGTPYYHWQLRFSTTDIQAKLHNSGHDIGNLQSIELSKLTRKAKTIAIADRTASGRVKCVCFVGDKARAVLSGNEVRNILGLKSTLFDITVTAINKNSMLKNKDKNSYNTIGEVLIDGYGWGHGLGLSQWGAKIMAEKKYDYKKILHHYYTNVDITKVY